MARRLMVRHVAFVLTRYQVGHDGFTPWRRLTWKTWKTTVAEFGEQVLGKLALKRPSTDRKVKKGNREKRDGHLGWHFSSYGRAHCCAAERRAERRLVSAQSTEFHRRTGGTPQL